MTKSFNKFKKSCFWPIFGHLPNVGDKKNFSGKFSSATSSNWFLASCQNLEKNNDTIPRNDQSDRRKEGWTDLIL